MITMARLSARSRGHAEVDQALRRAVRANRRKHAGAPWRSCALVAAVSAAAATRGHPAENSSLVRSRRQVSTMEASRALGVLDIQLAETSLYPPGRRVARPEQGIGDELLFAAGEVVLERS